MRSLKIEIQKEGPLRLLCPYESHTQAQNTRRQNHFSQGQEGKRVGAHKASHRGVVQLHPGCKMHFTWGWGTVYLTHTSTVPWRRPFSHWWGPTLSLLFGRLFGILWPWKQANIGCAWKLEKLPLKDIPTQKAYRKSPLRMVIFKSNIMAASWTLEDEHVVVPIDQLIDDWRHFVNWRDQSLSRNGQNLESFHFSPSLTTDFSLPNPVWCC